MKSKHLTYLIFYFAIVTLSLQAQPIRFNRNYVIPPGSNSTVIYSIINLDTMYLCVGVNQYSYPQGVISFTMDSIGNLLNEKEFGDSNSLYLMSEESYVKNGIVTVGFINKNYNYSPMHHDITYYYFSGYDTIKSKIIVSNIPNCSITKLVKKDGSYYYTGWIDTLSSTYYWLVKTDSLGNKLWEKYYGGGGGEIGYQIISTKDNNLLLLGKSYSFGNNSPYDNGQWYLVKVDTAGNVLWAKTYGNPNLNDHRPFGLTETRDSCYLVSGSYAVGMSGSAELLRGRILKIDKNGNVIWSKLYGKQATPYTYMGTVKEKTDGNIIVIFNDGAGYYSINNPVICELDFQGRIKWFRKYLYNNDTTADASVLNSFDFTADGGYIFAGYGLDYDSVPAQRSWVIKTDSLGFDGVTDFSADTAYRIELAADTCYGDTAVVVAHLYGVTAPYAVTYAGYGTHDSLYYSPMYEPYIADTLFLTSAMLTTGDSILQIPVTVTDGLGRVLYDTLTVNVCCLVSGIYTTAWENAIKIYPNPATDNLTIVITNEKLRITNVSIFDVMGKEQAFTISGNQPNKQNIPAKAGISSQQHPASMNTRLRGYVKVGIGSLPAGVYFVKIATNKGSIIKKIVKQ